MMAESNLTAAEARKLNVYVAFGGNALQFWEQTKIHFGISTELFKFSF